MANIIFTKDSDTFTFSQARALPAHDPVSVNVVTGYTEGMQLYAYDKGVVEQEFQLVFTRLTQTDFENFTDWLQNIAVGPKNTFTFTDEDGDDHTVRLMDVENPLSLVANTYYKGTITLREEVA
ncbi:hypothetical protein [Desulfatibacillum aliphaticivorans]|uniref:hypothetical protein n=1 Tax=Desulfatibacillum aliphaticivorans TaxID=218208 RepID=UPI0003FC2790|nr:hypothetical protein [Desulfatibacillum aliphaticivorans]